MDKRPDVAVNKIEFDSSEVDMALRKKFQKNRYFYITGAILVHCGNARIM